MIICWSSKYYIGAILYYSWDVVLLHNAPKCKLNTFGFFTSLRLIKKKQSTNFIIISYYNQTLPTWDK